MKIEGASGTNDYVVSQTTGGQPIRQREVEINVENEVAKIAEIINNKVETNIPIDERIKDYPEYVPSVAEKTIINAIEAANKKLEGISTEFRFSVHEGTKEINVKVLNKETGEVIREIPPEKILDMVAKMWELAGLFVDERR